MANIELVEILKQGFDIWNKWRDDNPDMEIDFREVDLHGVDLNKTNLKKVNLSGANLNEADLRGAILEEINLSSANLYKAKFSLVGYPNVIKIAENVKYYALSLKRANLSKANLCEVDLNGAYLNNVNLSGAELKKSTLNGASLSGADLRNAILTDADLSDADLSNADLSGSDFSGANLKKVNLSGANLYKSNLSKVNLIEAYLAQASLIEVDLGGADLREANLKSANLSKANLRKANLTKTYLVAANLTNADLSNSDLTGSSLVRTVVDKAKVSGSSVYGINVWDLIGEFGEQKDLIITPEGDAVITVDNIKVAQFIYLILNNEEIRDVINALTSKTVLILGRFSIPDRKLILNTLRNKLREYDLLPIVFDFDRPTDKDFTETIKTLAGLCYFVIADVTNPKSSPLELQGTVPDYQIPFVPIIQEGERPFAMMVDLQKKYNWVLNTVSYDLEETLMKVLKPLIIDPAMKKRQELRIVKAQQPEVISGKDFLNKEKE